jgi:hypothetical protein
MIRRVIFVFATLALVGCDFDEPPGEFRVCCPGGSAPAPGCPADSCPKSKTGKAQDRLSIACAGEPSVRVTTCDDGIEAGDEAGDEECDDGNASNADTCSNACETRTCTCQ